MRFRCVFRSLKGFRYMRCCDGVMMVIRLLSCCLPCCGFDAIGGTSADWSKNVTDERHMASATFHVCHAVCMNVFHVFC